MISRTILLLICALLCSVIALAQCTDERASRQQIVEQGLLPAIVLSGQPTPSYSISQRMKHYSVPGVSVAVINDGHIEWAEGYGLNRAGTTDSVTTQTVFQAASISKPVAAAGALRLVQEGQLVLDEDVNVRLRSWRVPANEHTAKQPVTLRGLLSHSAGVTVHGFRGYATGEKVPTLVEVLDGVEPTNSVPIRVDTIPGSLSRYSGGGYLVLQQLVEDVTGASFARVMQDVVLLPLGMEKSTFEQPLPEWLAHQVAAAHDWKAEPILGGWHIYPEQAAAGLWTTPSDLARFAIGLQRSFHGESQALLNQETARLMLTEVIGGTGLGLGVSGTGDGLHFTHGGSNKGYRSYMVAYPNTGDGVVVMTNGDGGDDLMMEVVRGVARVYGWPDYAPEVRTVAAVASTILDAYSGTYRFERAGFSVTVEREDNHLLVLTPRGSQYTFYPASESKYYGVEDGSTLTFTEGRDDLSVWGLHARRVQ